MFALLCPPRGLTVTFPQHRVDLLPGVFTIKVRMRWGVMASDVSTGCPHNCRKINVCVCEAAKRPSSQFNTHQLQEQITKVKCKSWICKRDPYFTQNFLPAERTPRGVGEVREGRVTYQTSPNVPTRLAALRPAADACPTCSHCPGGGAKETSWGGSQRRQPGRMSPRIKSNVCLKVKSARKGGGGDTVERQTGDAVCSL